MMRYRALATDYDGTLALHGRVDAATLRALERLRGSGRRLILVSGRELDDLRGVFGQLDLCDFVVVENGALLYDPAGGEELPLGAPPDEEFVARLRRSGVAPLSVGRVIVATREPNGAVVDRVIRELGLDLQVIRNKGALMVLPSGITKAAGLGAALERMGLKSHEVVAVGDAENDRAMLSMCGYAVAVANALDELKARADWVTAGDHGAGVVQLIDAMIAGDLADRPSR